MNSSMIFSKSEIYSLVKDYPLSFKLVTFNKNNRIVKAGDESQYIWYLLEGSVLVVANSNSGKSIVVDTIPPDNFVGHLSNLSGQNFYTDSFASSKCILLQFDIQTFKELLRDIDFCHFFYKKVNNRLYIMYKKDLANHLFSPKEQFASYLLTSAKDRKCHIGSLYKICELIRVSRRSLYNIIDIFIEEGLIERDEDGHILILDQEGLESHAANLTAFLNNTM